MKKQRFSIQFKKEVLEYMNQGNSCYSAAKYFSNRDQACYNRSMFQNWFKNREAIKDQSNSMNRIKGGGRKTLLGNLEDLIFNEIIELRIMKIKVSRSFISDRAIDLALANHVDFKGSSRFIDGFMKRYGLSLRKTTNFTTLSDDELIRRAVYYMSYLQNSFPSINMQKTLLMDETAVYFEDNRTQTVDVRGRQHIVMKSTGFSSMRITVVASIWGDGRKASPLIIHKGKDTDEIKQINGILNMCQKSAWVNQNLIIKWIDHMFPIIDISPGKCIVWDSCRAHISLKVKEHCQKKNIKLIVIPGGLTPYLQALDIGVFKEFKDNVYSEINIWKNSTEVEYTKNGNPKAPTISKINSWVKYSWNKVSKTNIANSIKCAGFSSSYEDWHIAKHEIYGSKFINAFIASKCLNMEQLTFQIDNNIPEDPDVFDLCDE